MNITNIMAELPRHRAAHYKPRDLSRVDTIVVHHSAAQHDEPEDGWDAVVHNIADYHVKHNGWPGIGYHYVIDPDGGVWKTNALSTLSYHARGGNAGGIGVMLLGHFDHSDPTVEQMASLKELVREVHGNMPQVKRVIGHRDVPGARTACPGANLTATMLDALAQLVSIKGKA